MGEFMNETGLIDLYDSEVKILQETLATLQGRTYKRHNLQAFDDEVVERFAEKGFEVQVAWHETNERGLFMPVIEVVGRIERLKEFDHDRMRHEVVGNLLDLPSEDAGVIKPSGLWTPPEHKH